ncbi:MAG TPA: cytochrome c maturation protein CcmE [Vicinamibacteria bacterium]|nr:cytochrome c maturation protein CcmE [Vicinamibacteria bacterium]
MPTKKLKFIAGTALILGSVLWLAISGFEEGKAYYQTVSELKSMGSRAEGVRLRVGGIVVPGSIVRREGAVEFQISQDNQILPVRYVGKGPLPDTLVDRAEALAEGHYRDGSFEASMVQAKCASKYEAAYGESSEAGPES